MENNTCLEKQPLCEEMLEKMNAYWRAANYLSAGQLYLLDNPLLKKPLSMDQIKKKIVGHWGTVPGQNFIYTHCNRAIKRYDLDMILLSGPGHGGNFLIANTYLEGSYSEVYPNISQDEEGMKKMFKQFSFPCGVPSHCAPETPGSINEGGELGYSIAHAFGAVFDNPDLIATVVVGDGEAETGPLATSWQSNKFLNPVTDGAVLPILHLNGYKISNPTIFSRLSHEELKCFFKGCGWKPYFVEGDDPMTMHKKMAETMDTVIEEIKAIQKNARENNDPERPVWPMIVLRTPKGWTGPKVVDGLQIEGSFRAHQVPITMEKPEHLELLNEWLESYRPQELFDKNGRLIPELAELAPKGNARLGANPHANGGLLLKDLRLPDFRSYGIDVQPGKTKAQEILNDIKATAQEKTEKLFTYGVTVIVIGILLSVFQQAIGINAVLYYAPRIFENAGAEGGGMMQTVIMGIVNIIFTLVAIFTVDRFGRKPLLIIGSIGMAVGAFAVAMCDSMAIKGVLPVLSIIVYAAFFMMSWGPICWVLISEIFPNTIRGKAVAIAVAFQWIFNYIVSSTFPALYDFSPMFAYSLYGIICVAAAIFVWRWVPETKGKTLEDMSKLWKKNK